MKKAAPIKNRTAKNAVRLSIVAARSGSSDIFTLETDNPYQGLNLMA
jgi:hypothetical protein